MVKCCQNGQNTESEFDKKGLTFPYPVGLEDSGPLSSAARLKVAVFAGSMLALGTTGGRVMLVDEATGEIRWEIEASDSSTRVAMSPDGRLVASLGLKDEHWKLLDSSSGEVHRVGAKHDGTKACICEVPDSGQRLLQEGCPVVAHTGALRTVAFSPCGQMLATGGNDNTVILWDVEKGGAQQRLQVNAGHTEVRSLSFSANGARLACRNTNGSIHVWSLATGSLLRTIAPPHASSVRSVHFSPTDSARLVSVCYGLPGSAAPSCIHLWDVESGELERRINGYQFAECHLWTQPF